MDTASLYISVDSSEADKGVKSLADLARQGQATESSLHKTGESSKSLKAVAREADVASRAMSSLAMAAKGLIATMGVGQIIQMADGYTKFTAQLKLATASTQEYATAHKEVQRIAKTAQADLSATAVLYARIANGTRELGISQQRVAKITESVNLAMKVSGATAEESASAMLQLSQAFASGVLRGEEFNAVNEAAPRLMKALADGMGVAVGGLRDMATEGQITSKIMAEALPKALETLRVEAKSVETIGGAFTNLKNEVLQLVGTQAQASGFVSGMTSGMSLLADNLTLVAGATATVAASRLAQWLAAVATQTYGVATANEARLASAVAVAKADTAATAATIAQAAATQSMIVLAREEAVVKLAGANASVVSARSALLAAEAAGAQSFALRAQRIATTELTAAETARSASLAALATLGKQQASLSAQVAAATNAEAAAKTRLAAANASASVGARALSSAMALFGGPVGLLTVAVIGGAAAWSSYRESADEVRNSLLNLSDPLDQVREKFEKLTKLEQGRALEGLRAQIEESGAAMKEALQSLESVPLKLRVSPDFADFKKQIQAITKSDIGADELERKLTGLVTGFLATVPGAASARNAVESFANEAVKAARATEELSRRQDALAPKADDSAKAMNRLAIEAARAAAGLDTKKWTEYISKLESAAVTVGMNAGQLAEYAAQSMGASSEQAKLAGVINASAEAAKALEKATADKDSKALKGANDLLGALVAQEVQLRVNVAQASAYAALLAMGLSAESALQGSQTEAELIGLRELDNVLARIAAVRKNVAENTELSTAATKAGAKALSDAAKAAADFAKARESELESIYNSISAIQEQAQALEDEAATYGMGKAAIEALTISRLQEQKAMLAMYGREANPAVEAIEAEIEARERLGAAMSVKDRLDEEKKANEETKREWEKTVDQYGDVFRRGFADMLNNGKDGWKSFTKSLVTTFKTSVADQIYKMFAQPFVVNLVGNMMGLMGGGAAAAGMTGAEGGAAGAASGLGNIMNVFGVAKNLYSLFTGGITSSIASSLSTMGGVIGSSAMQSFALGMTGKGATLAAGLAGPTTAGSAAAGAGSAFAGAIPVIGWIAAGMMANQALYKKGWDATNGSLNPGVDVVFGGATGAVHKALEGLGMSGSLASLLSGSAITSALFGRRNKEYGATSINGQFTGTGFRGYTETPWDQKGGLFRSSKSGMQYGNLDRSYEDSLGASFLAIRSGVAQLVDSIGISADSLLGYTQSIKLTLTGDAAGDDALITNMLKGVGENMIRSVIPTIGQYVKESESAMDALQRLSVSLSMANGYMKVLGNTLFDVSLVGADAASKLADAFGGMDKMTEITQAFYEVAYTEGERATASMEAMRVALQSIGVSMPRTMRELREMALALDLTTDAGREAYAALLAVAPQFAAVTDALANAAQALGDKLMASFSARSPLMAALDAVQLKTLLLGDTLVSTYESMGSISTLFLDLDSGLITFGGAVSTLDGEMTGAQEASAILADQIGALQVAAKGAVIDFAAFEAQLATIDTDGFIATIAKAFQSLAQRIDGVIGEIGAERIAVRQAAQEILDPSAMTPEMIRRQIAGINTTLPSGSGVLESGARLAVADAESEAKRKAAELAKKEYEPAQANYDGASKAISALVGQVANAQALYDQAYGGATRHYKYSEGRAAGRMWAAQLPGLGADLDASKAALAAAQAASTSAKLEEVNRLQEVYNAALAESTAATAAAAAAALDAKQTQIQFADALQDFAIDAGKSVAKLSNLREETLKYYQAQKQLAELMGASAFGLRKTVADYRYSQMSPDEQFNRMQGEYAKNYAMALSTDGETLSGYADKMNAALAPMIEAARNSFGSQSQYDGFVATALARAEAIAGRLDTLAPDTYDAESLALLGQIDATLAALEESSRSAEQLIVAAVNASRDATVDGLRQIANALTGGEVAAFAAGGLHAGGLRIVGENGPELEATGPSRIFTASQTSAMLSGGGSNEMAAELRALRHEVANLRIEARATATTSAKTARSLEKLERGGIGVYAQDDEALPIIAETV